MTRGTRGIAALKKEVRDLRFESTSAALPGDSDNPRDSNSARLLGELYQVKSMLDDMHNYQADGPYRPPEAS